MNRFTILSTVSIIGLLTSHSSIAQNPLNDAKGFNVFVKGSASLSSNETEGPVAMGGDMNLVGNYQINVHNVGTYKSLKGNLVGLYIGGKVNYQSGNETKVLNNRYLKIGNLTGSTLTIAGGSTKVHQQGSSPDSNPKIFVGFQQPATDPVLLADEEKIDFEEAFATMKATALNIANCENNVQLKNANGQPISFVPDNGQVKITLTAGKPNILAISGSELNKIVSITMDGPAPSLSTPLVINVNSVGTFNWDPFVINGMQNSDAQYVLYNFSAATTVNIKSRDQNIRGTVFAPFADIYKTINSNIDGQIVGNSYSQSSAENHYQPFLSDVPGCPSRLPLPVELTYFKGQATAEQTAVLQWQTAGERNSSHFLVQRSRDARSFETLATVKAAGTTSERHDYSYTDQKPGYGVNYYRLIQVDTDGTATPQKTVSVIVDSPENRLFSVFPNPGNGSGFSVRVQDKAASQLSLMSLQGTIIPVETGSDSDATVIRVVPKTPLTAGLYVLTVRDTTGTYARKVMVR
ncbi:collagen-binding domain-containing protein [Siphonobacter aquaeclarae]|uniref:Por secretion system C-terminal sorting domain-containing protein/choice-of-anchor A domain-containing protein n=1 Tax=Siphonobacter aquaeclarae TaxID=563176 RepID=A0A1G9R0W9_9BACT|nr:collagen-binding domain-containing protein [Siphonobacter aquaeclarae]SDM16899.1 Por secretion system C-terminal sorting domain-containing protein/choice-of-anchor A domain-containing protein [Siphonobacter aquaeclarae]